MAHRYEDEDCDKSRNTYRLKNPKKTNLRFFAYDVFKKDEIAYSRISDFVDEENSEYFRVDYSLNIMNGVPFLVKSFGRYYNTSGYLIKFKNNDADEAYKIISDAKSLKLYGWDTISINKEKINVLFAKEDIINFKYAESYGEYESVRDPMLVDSVVSIWNNFTQIIGEKFSKDNFFNLQMNYMLLWSSIDRYVTLKYGKRNQQENLKYLSNEKSFEDAVLKYSDKYNNIPSVFSNEDFRSFELNKNKPLCCIRYYYTIRCNVVHMGKSTYDDYKLLKFALFELLLIYMHVLRDSLNDDSLFKDIFFEMEYIFNNNVLFDKLFSSY